MILIPSAQIFHYKGAEVWSSKKEENIQESKSISLANMEREDVETLQSVFNLYVRDRIESEDMEYEDIMNKIWNRIRETHLLRVVK